MSSITIPQESSIAMHPASDITIQQVYGTETVKEFEQLVTGLGWELNREAPRTIVRWKKESNIEVQPSLKGLIYVTETGKICAPGVPIPIKPEQKGDAKTIGYSLAIDGFMIRFWSTNDTLFWSTNGSISAGQWQHGDIGRMISDLLQAGDQCDVNLLKQAVDRNRCYFAILEHPDMPNIYKAHEPRLTLVRIMDQQGTSYPLDSDTIFTHVNKITPVHQSLIHFKMFMNSPLTSATVEPLDRPVTPDTYGVVAHLDNGETYRLLSFQAEEAEKARPNYREVWQHWIYNVRETAGPEEWKLKSSKLNLYKTYFPWNSNMMDGLSSFFSFKVPQKDQKAFLKSNGKLRELALEYETLLNEVGRYSLDDEGHVTNKVLGNFPDIESVEKCIASMLEKPQLLIERLASLKL
jgi:hypothetical protein